MQFCGEMEPVRASVCAYVNPVRRQESDARREQERKKKKKISCESEVQCRQTHTHVSREQRLPLEICICVSGKGKNEEEEEEQASQQADGSQSGKRAAQAHAVHAKNPFSLSLSLFRLLSFPFGCIHILFPLFALESDKESGVRGAAQHRPSSLAPAIAHTHAVPRHSE